MHLLHDTTWSEIFDEWANHEENNPAWQHTATVVKGWPDWRSWRMFTVGQLKLAQRSWQFFAIDDPAKEVAHMLIGPYSGWQSRLPEPNVGTFVDLLNIPEQYRYYAENTKLAETLEHFPAETQMIGLRRPDGKIVCVEGHHRALAIALAMHDHLPIPKSHIRMALADLAPDTQELLDKTLARGTTKDPKPLV